MLLGGLGLLSVHHKWAHDILVKARDKTTNLYEMFFPDNKKLYLLYDLVGATVFVGSLYVIYLETGLFVQTLAIGVLLIASGLLLTNRKRLQKISLFVKKRTKRKH